MIHLQAEIEDLLSNLRIQVNNDTFSRQEYERLLRRYRQLAGDCGDPSESVEPGVAGFATVATAIYSVTAIGAVITATASPPPSWSRFAAFVAALVGVGLLIAAFDVIKWLTAAIAGRIVGQAVWAAAIGIGTVAVLCFGQEQVLRRLWSDGIIPFEIGFVPSVFWYWTALSVGALYCITAVRLAIRGRERICLFLLSLPKASDVGKEGSIIEKEAEKREDRRVHKEIQVILARSEEDASVGSVLDDVVATLMEETDDSVQDHIGSTDPSAHESEAANRTPGNLPTTTVDILKHCRRVDAERRE